MDNEHKLVFNGINGASGDYLLPPMTPQAISRIAQGEELDKDHLDELKGRHVRDTVAVRGVKEGIDPTDLAEAGWGIIFAYEDQERVPAIREALGQLLDLRREGAGEYYKEYTGPKAYRPGESKQEFLARHGVGPGPSALLFAHRGRPGDDPLSLSVPTGRTVRRGTPAL